MRKLELAKNKVWKYVVQAICCAWPSDDDRLYYISQKIEKAIERWLCGFSKPVPWRECRRGRQDGDGGRSGESWDGKTASCAFCVSQVRRALEDLNVDM